MLLLPLLTPPSLPPQIQLLLPLPVVLLLLLPLMLTSPLLVLALRMHMKFTEACMRRLYGRFVVCCFEHALLRHQIGLAEVR